MSHHIHILPQFLPLEQPLKPDKKRRLRKLRGGQTAYTSDVDEADDIDEVFAVAPPQGRSKSASARSMEEPEEDTGQPIASTYSGATMRTLLKAQEES